VPVKEVRSWSPSESRDEGHAKIVDIVKLILYLFFDISGHASCESRWAADANSEYFVTLSLVVINRST
jgi:hypothetical protein